MYCTVKKDVQNLSFFKSSYQLADVFSHSSCHCNEIQAFLPSRIPLLSSSPLFEQCKERTLCSYQQEVLKIVSALEN